jgi:small GTP-binding protein
MSRQPPKQRKKRQQLFKIIIVGAGKVGKTSLTIRYAENRFRESYLPTLGVDFLTKTLDIRGRSVKLQLWDTGGQEFVISLLPYYYSGAAGGVLVFDLTNRNSFNSLDYWLKQIRRNAGDIPIILAGNKIDLSQHRKVQSEDAEAFAQRHDLLYIETSAKTGVNVSNLFKHLLGAVFDYRDKLAKQKAEEEAKSSVSDDPDDEFSFWKRV